MILFAWNEYLFVLQRILIESVVNNSKKKKNIYLLNVRCKCNWTV